MRKFAERSKQPLENMTHDPGQETEAEMVWPCFKVIWLSKDNPRGHSERKKKMRQTEEEVGWLVGCFGLNGPLRQYFSLYRAVSLREGERKDK